MTFLADFFGTVNIPPGVNKYGGFGEDQGILLFANNILKLVIVGAGLFAFANIIIAGYGFLSAGGDPKKVGESASRIWQSLIGLLLVAGSFVLAAIFGQLIFGDWTAILSPKIYGPERIPTPPPSTGPW